MAKLTLCVLVVFLDCLSHKISLQGKIAVHFYLKGTFLYVEIYCDIALNELPHILSTIKYKTQVANFFLDQNPIGSALFYGGR